MTIDSVRYLILILHDGLNNSSIFSVLTFTISTAFSLRATLLHFYFQLSSVHPCGYYPAVRAGPYETMEASMHDVDDVRVAPLRECQTRVIDYIEKTFNQILQDIQIRLCGHPSIVLKRIADTKPRDPDDCLEVIDREMKISFPGKTKEEAWRFSQSWSWL